MQLLGMKYKFLCSPTYENRLSILTFCPCMFKLFLILNFIGIETAPPPPSPPPNPPSAPVEK